VADEIYGLFEDLEDLMFTDAGVVFPGPADHVDRVFQHLAADLSWSFLDLRVATTDAITARLASIKLGARVLIAVDTRKSFSDLMLNVLRARYDRTGDVCLAPGRILLVHRASTLLFAFGGHGMDEVPGPVVEQIDCWLDLSLRTFRKDTL
jgi:hypothetical protein